MGPGSARRGLSRGKSGTDAIANAAGDDELLGARFKWMLARGRQRRGHRDRERLSDRDDRFANAIDVDRGRKKRDAQRQRERRKRNQIAVVLRERARQERADRRRDEQFTDRVAGGNVELLAGSGE